MLKKFQQKVVLDSAFKRLRKVPLIHVGSGKGGSGKSTVAATIGLKLSQLGFRVGIGDFDQTPNIITAFNRNINEYERGKRDKWNRYLPFEINQNLKIMSFQLLKPEGEGYFLTGPNLAEHIYQLLYTTKWGKLDYFITDNPSGSYDSLDLQKNLFNKISVIIITEPHIFSINNCEEFIDNCIYQGVNIFGIIENKVFYKCPSCGLRAHLAGRPQARKLASKYDIHYLGGIPEEERIANLDISHLLGNGFVSKSISLITNKNWNWQ